jgi:hypothetical protein
MQKIRTGNVYCKPNGDRGWIMGNFPNRPLPYPFSNKQFEIKWAEQEKGEKKSGAKSDGRRQTLTILVRGKHSVEFPESQKRFLLKREGDYVFFEPGVLHSWEAIQDNLTITIRWSAKRRPHRSRK